MKKYLLIAIFGAFFLSISTPGLTHHSTTMFDKNKTITLTGVVKKFQYTNPHSWLIVEVTDENGEVVTWGFEAEGPSTLMRGGIAKSDFLPGTKVTVTGHPMRNGRKAAYWLKVVREEDGKVFDSQAGFIPR